MFYCLILLQATVDEYYRSGVRLYSIFIIAFKVLKLKNQYLNVLFAVCPTNLVTIDVSPIENIFTLKTISITTGLQ